MTKRNSFGAEPITNFQMTEGETGDVISLDL